MTRENYSRYFCKQEVIKFLLTCSFRKMLITGLISKHNHVTYFRRELLIFFWLTLVDFFSLKFDFSPHERNDVYIVACPRCWCWRVKCGMRSSKFLVNNFQFFTIFQKLRSSAKLNIILPNIFFFLNVLFRRNTSFGVWNLFESRTRLFIYYQ